MARGELGRHDIRTGDGHAGVVVSFSLACWVIRRSTSSSRPGKFFPTSTPIDTGIPAA
jgi:hypothetical protein